MIPAIIKIDDCGTLYKGSIYKTHLTRIEIVNSLLKTETVF